MSARTAIEMGATIYGSEFFPLCFIRPVADSLRLQSLLTLLPLPTRLVDPFLRSFHSLLASFRSTDLTCMCRPGRGVMGTAREVSSKIPSQVLDIAYRKRQLEFRRKQISQWLQNETELLQSEFAGKEATAEDFIAERLAHIETEAKRQESEALGTFGMLAGADPTISPLRRALAVWGLTIDDVGVASVRCFFARARLVLMFHSSSTVLRLSPTTRTSRERTTSSSDTSVDRSETLVPSSRKNSLPVIPRVRLSVFSRCEPR